MPHRACTGSLQGSYYGWDSDAIHGALQHAPTQDIYDGYDSIWRTYWWDIAAHWTPQSGTISSPSNRQYDPWMASNNRIDGLELPLIAHTFSAPACNSGFVGQSSQYYNPQWFTLNSTLGTPINACLPGAPNGILPSMQGAVFSQTSFQRWPWVAAGVGYVPYDVFSNISIQYPYRRIEQLFCNEYYCSRSNFITPYYSIGFSTEDLYHIGFTQPVFSRLMGQSIASKPRYISGNTQTSNAVGSIRSYLGNDESTSGGLLQRSAGVQYQSFEVITQLAYQGRGGNFSLPLTSEYWFPLAVDGLYADSTLISLGVNTSYALPPKTIFCAKHQNGSTCVRLLYVEHGANSKIADATSITNLGTSLQNSLQEGQGLEPYSFMFIQDPNGYSHGFGRLVAALKQTNDGTQAPLKVAWLVASGLTRTVAELQQLQSVIRNAPLNNQINLASNWVGHNYDGTTININNLAVQTQSSWTINVTLPSNVNLGLYRSDQYQPWGFEGTYSSQSNTQFPPFQTFINRTVNTIPQLLWQSGASPYRAYSVDPCVSWYQPHLTTPPPGCTTLPGTGLGASFAAIVATPVPSAAPTPAPTTTLSTSAPSFASYLGCFADYVNSARAFPTKIAASSTVTACTTLARQQGYTFAGLEYYGECWAGNSKPSEGTSTNCNTPCSDNSNCGGSFALSTYQITPLVTPAPTPSPTTPAPTPAPTTVMITPAPTGLANVAPIYTSPASTTAGVTYSVGIATTPSAGQYNVELIPATAGSISSATITYSLTGSGVNLAGTNTRALVSGNTFVYPVPLVGGQSLTWTFTFVTAAGGASATTQQYVISTGVPATPAPTTVAVTPAPTTSTTAPSPAPTTVLPTVIASPSVTPLYTTNSQIDTPSSFTYQIALSTTTGSLYNVELLPATTSLASISRVNVFVTLTGTDKLTVTNGPTGYLSARASYAYPVPLSNGDFLSWYFVFQLTSGASVTTTTTTIQTAPTVTQAPTTAPTPAPTTSTAANSALSGSSLTPVAGLTYTYSASASQLSFSANPASLVTQVIVHYTIDNGTQQNVIMSAAPSGNYVQPITLSSGDSVTYSFTYFTKTAGAYDTTTYTLEV